MAKIMQPTMSRFLLLFVAIAFLTTGFGGRPLFAEKLIIPLGKATIVRAPGVKKILAVKEGVVEVLNVTPDEIILSGIGAASATTQLIIWDPDGKKIYDVETYEEVDVIQQKFASLYGGPGVNLQMFPDVVYIRGMVDTPEKKAKAEKIVEGLVTDRKIESLLEIQSAVTLKQRIEDAIKLPTVKVTVITPEQPPGTELTSTTSTATDTKNVRIILEGTVENQNDYQHLYEIVLGFVEEDSISNLVAISNPTQVVFQAYILEMTRDAQKDLGIRWGTANGLGGDLKQGVVNFYENVSNAWRGDAQTVGAPVPKHINPFHASNLNRFEIIDAQISALERDNKAKVLANPKLIVYANGKPTKIALGGWLGEGDQEIGKEGKIGQKPDTDSGLAFFETGTDKQYIAATDNNGRPQFDKVSARLRLAVRDLFVLNDDLKFSVFALQEEVIPSGNQAPDKSTRSLMTTIKVRNGQTVVLGGLISKKTTVAEEKVPILSKIPYLGRMFRWKRDTVSENELVILLTPEILNKEKDPMAGKKVEVIPVPRRTEHLEKLHQLFQKIKTSHFPEETGR